MKKQCMALTILCIFGMLSMEGCVPSRQYSSEAESGRKIFNGEGMCFGCHGKNADGSTDLEPIASQVQPNPPDLRNSQSLRHQTSKDVYRFLKDRLHGPVSDEEIWQIIAFLYMIRN